VLFLLGSAALAVGIARTNLELARARGDRVAQALLRYRADHGRWPADLDALAPVYLDRVPSPRIMLSPNRFLYEHDDDVPRFGFVIAPPNGSRYDFARGRWEPLD